MRVRWVGRRRFPLAVAGGRDGVVGSSGGQDGVCEEDGFRGGSVSASDLAHLLTILVERREKMQWVTAAKT